MTGKLETIDGKTIDYEKDASELILPENVYKITGSFPRLERIVINEGCKILDASFGWALSEAELPRSLEAVNGDPFKYCDPQYLSIYVGIRTYAFNWLIENGYDVQDEKYGFKMRKDNLDDESVPYGIVAVWGDGWHTEIESVIIPNCITSIRWNTFDDYYQLKTITIPESVKEIDDDAFPHPEAITIIAPNGSYACKWAEKMGATFMELKEYE